MGIGGRTPALRPAVFFDRDGVLNAAVVRDGRPHPPASVDELVIDEAAQEVVTRLRALGFAIIVVTNQPDVARGTTPRATVDAINARLATQVSVDDVLTCFHDGPDRCECRKPKPGMLLAAAQTHAIELSRSYMVGDRWSDIAAGASARCRTVWIERGYRERLPDSADARVASLLLACNWIIDDVNSRGFERSVDLVTKS